LIAIIKLKESLNMNIVEKLSLSNELVHLSSSYNQMAVCLLI